MRKRSRALVAVVGIVGGFVALGVPTRAPAADEPRVAMVDNEPDLTRWHFDPATVTVSAGATVVWVNSGKEDHSVTADDKSFDSGLKKSGATFSRAFPRPGTYAYHCQPHPWMKGLVEVTAAAAPTPTSAAAPPTIAAPAPTAPAETPGSATPSVTENPPAAPDAPAGESDGDRKESDDKASAAASHSDKRSGGHLAGTLALVLLPTLGALALGAKLRRSRS